MINGLVNGLKETDGQGTFLPSFVPHFFNNVKSDIDSFDDADEPLNSGGDGETFVKPHFVSDYTKANGTSVGGFWRDGDGDTSVDLTEDEGGGYTRDI
jgi:hypothetical protein